MRKWLYVAVVVLLVYVVVAMTYYRFQHPEMTETQLFMRFGDALIWKDK